MEKRYQVFISSTFTDLKDERQAVLKSILELDHMPAGMELFPATDDSAWELIEDIIDNSDYYILIVGGRYGSLDEKGIGYTEKEYDYAISTKKPVIPLLHQNPDNLAREKTETDAAAWTRLKAFRAKVEKKHTCVYWQNADELKAKVIVGLTTAIKRHPAIGWVRADNVPNETTLLEMLALKTRVAELEAETSLSRDRRPEGTEDLAQGEDEYEFAVSFSSRGQGSSYAEKEYSTFMLKSWNAIFASVAPCLIQEAPERVLRHAFQQFLLKAAKAEFGSQKQFKNSMLGDFRIKSEDIDTCLIQLRALGLIKPNDKKRSIKDTGIYWTLTPYGNTLMVRLRAIRKDADVEDDIPEVIASDMP
jgi:hypothetical protein